MSCRFPPEEELVLLSATVAAVALAALGVAIGQAAPQTSRPASGAVVAMATLGVAFLLLLVAVARHCWSKRACRATASDVAMYIASGATVAVMAAALFWLGSMRRPS